MIKNFKSSGSKHLSIIAIAVLCILYFAGLKRQQNKIKNVVSDNYPELYNTNPVNTSPLIYKVNNNDSADFYYKIFSSGHGWGGLFSFSCDINSKGEICDINILSHCETPSYILKLDKNNFFKQFNGLKSDALLSLNDDVDAVTGATISSSGFTNAIRKVNHEASYILFNKVGKVSKKSFQFSWKEISIFILFLITLISSLLKFKKSRNLAMIGGMIILGFIFNFPVSISQFSSIFLGYIPHPFTNLVWWIIIIGSLLLIIFTGKNLYCSWICPFGAIQELINKISVFKVPIHPVIIKYGKNFLYFFSFISVGTMFYFRNTSIGNYEPFAALFKFDGYGLIWLIMPIVMLSSFFIKRFYCRFFCPAGAALTLSTKLRLLFKRKEKVNCIKRNKITPRKSKLDIVSLLLYVIIAYTIVAFIFDAWFK